MAFLNEFAYGFEQTAKPMLEAKARANADADAKIREQVAAVDPEAQLYQRKKDIDAAASLQRQQQETSMLSPNLKQDMQANGLLPSDTPSTPNPMTPAPDAGSAATPSPTIMGSPAATPFTPTGATATPPTTAPQAAPDHFGLYQGYTVEAAKALRAGDREGYQTYKDMADLHKTAMEHDLAANKVEPIPNKTAEGVNAVEQVSKETDENIKAGGDSVYMPPDITQSTANPKVANFDRQMASTIQLEAPLLAVLVRALLLTLTLLLMVFPIEVDTSMVFRMPVKFWGLLAEFLSRQGPLLMGVLPI